MKTNILGKSLFVVLFSFILLGCDSKPEEKKSDKDMEKKESKTVKKAKVGVQASNNETFDLPKAKIDSEFSLEQAIQIRRSVRDFKDEALSLENVAQVLWSAYGLTREIKDGPEFLRGGLRTAPSAGATYPLDVYLVVGKVTGLKAGIYKYLSGKHKLELMLEGDYRKKLCEAGLKQKMLEEAPATLVYSAIFERTTRKYKERGRERYVCMDIGHSAQNVYLQTTALGLGTCAIGAFTDEMVSMLMPFSEDEEPLYMMPLGKIVKTEFRAD